MQLLDASGTVVAQSGVSVTVALSSGSGTLGGALTVTTDAAGQATFAGLSITGLVGKYSLGFSSSGLRGVTSATISLTPGAATELAMATQPRLFLQSGKKFNTAVQLRDVAGNDVALGGVSVTVGINSGSGGTLAGTLTVTTHAAGTASFSSLKLTGSGTYTLVFTSPSLAPVISSAMFVS